MLIDLHTHSLVSDGTDTPTELVANAARAELAVVALTDHDTFDGLAEAQAAGERSGVEVVPGMELSCSRGGQSVHLLAYGADPTDADLAEEMVRVREGRTDRLRPVLAKLADLGVPVTEESVRSFVGTSPSVGRPHIADALVVAGHVGDRKEAFDKYLADGGPAHVTRYTIDVARGIDLVHAAGGVAVIAHPWGRGREQVLPPEILEQLVVEHGLEGIEVDHQDHDQAARAGLRQLVQRLGILGTGASDYHGTGKTEHDLGCNVTEPETYARLRTQLAQRAAASVG